MKPRPDPRRRLMVPHPEYPLRGLDLVPSAPAGHEGAREGRVEEVDRQGVIQNAPQPGRSQRPAICATIPVEPRPHLIEPPAKSFGWHTYADADREPPLGLSPDRLVYLSSGMHQGVKLRIDDLLWSKRAWSGWSAYAESKLSDVLLAFAVARRWKNVRSNALEPGWVPTKMGGSSAPGDLRQGSVTQAWLAASEDMLARSTGGYFYHQRPRAPNAIANDVGIQEELLAECGRISGIQLAD